MRFEPVFTDPHRDNGGQPAGRPPANGRHVEPDPHAPRIYPPSAPAPVWAPAQPPPPRVDYAAVKVLRRQVSERFTAWLHGRDASDDEQQRERESLAAQLVAEYADTLRRTGTPFTSDDERTLLDALAADLAGLGRLNAVTLDPDVEEVHVLGCDRVRVTYRDGTVEWGAPIADSDAELVEMLQSAARRASANERSLSTAKPVLDLQLPDGSRLVAVYLVCPRPYVVIRRHNTLDVSLDDIAGGRRDLDETLDVLQRDFLRAAMAAGLNIMVGGLPGAGKTTVVRALMGEIPPTNRSSCWRRAASCSPRTPTGTGR